MGETPTSFATSTTVTLLVRVFICKLQLRRRNVYGYDNVNFLSF
jgi:hypothetical protein